MSGDISRNLQETLLKNGMKAHLEQDGEGYHLLVQSHDSPQIRYDISRKDALRLMSEGSYAANKKAYNTFTSIVREDFYMPVNYVHAQNVGTHVNLGLGGYRADSRHGIPPVATPAFRQPTMYEPHLRRLGGRVIPAAPVMMVSERRDGILRPGEMQSGGYGFYYKGNNSKTQKTDVLSDMGDIKVSKIQRANGEAVPYSEKITSPVYFTSDKFKEVLSSHGLVIDEKNKTLTVKSSEVPKDLRYKLSDEELSLTS